MKQTPDKTDYSDARLLADLERVGYLPRVWTAPAAVRDLREVVRYRHQLAAQRRAAKVRVRALLRQHRQKPPAAVRPWTIAWHKWLREQAALPESTRWVIDRHLAELADLARRTKAAHRLARYQPHWRAMKAALVGRGKPAGVAVAAVANRWVRRLFHQVQPVALAA